MKNHEMVMSIRESQRFAELEKLIAKGQKTFVEVGLALAEIRDLRLYKREYDSFREYCQKKWGWTKQHAYRLIEAAPIAKGHQLVTNERVARELGKAAPAERAGIVEQIVSEGKPVTAKEIRRHLPPPPMHPRGADGEPGVAAPKESPMGDSLAEAEDGANGTNRGVPPPPGQVLDGTGWPIPTQLIPMWQRAGEVQAMLSGLSRYKGALRAAQDNKDLLFAEVNFSSVLSHLDQARYDVKTAKPFAVCPTCQGQIPEKCTLCRGRGLISEHRWSTCVTREDKEFRVRAKQKAESRK